MKGHRRLGWWLTASLSALLVTVLLLPLRAHSGGEIDLRQCISKLEGVAVGETLTFGTCTLPVPDAIVRWDFGDGDKAEGWPVVHAYQSPGWYDVSAVATYRTGGPPIPTIPTRIHVVALAGNLAPQAQAVAAPKQTLAGLPITFDASASSDPDGTISRYYWDFRDGTKVITTTAQVQHIYARSGTYNVILTVTDNGETDASAVVPVTVVTLPTEVLPGVDRVIPEPLEKASRLALPIPLVFVDMGMYETGRFPPRYQFKIRLDPPFRLVGTSNRDWLAPMPTEYEVITGTQIEVTEYISVSNTSMLPRARTSWGQITVVINGWVMEVPVAVTVRGPNRDISEEVWSLHDEILDYLAGQGQRSAMVYSRRYANGSDVALGWITEYVLEDHYAGQMSRQEFVTKVAEMLMDQDVNGDGFTGFTDRDRGLGVKVDF